MHSGEDDAPFSATGCPIRKSPDQSLLAAPRGLSQLATSFIAFLRQVILRTPLVAWPQLPVLPTRYTTEYIRYPSCSVNTYCQYVKEFISRRTVREVWRRPGSNRRPPACKAGALPAELRPHKNFRERQRPLCVPWWALVDSNHRPRPYQGRALTS